MTDTSSPDAAAMADAAAPADTAARADTAAMRGADSTPDTSATRAADTTANSGVRESNTTPQTAAVRATAALPDATTSSRGTAPFVPGVVSADAVAAAAGAPAPARVAGSGATWPPATLAHPAAPERRAHSPCIGTCRMDDDNRYCAGCLRSIDEIAAWSTATEETRWSILHSVQQRRAARDDAA